MKNTISLMMLILSGSSLAVETCASNADTSYDSEITEEVLDHERSAVAKAAVEADKIYRTKLAQHLLTHEDINVRMVVLQHLAMFNDDSDEQSDELLLTSTKVADLLNQVLECEHASVASLLSAQLMCGQNQYISQCEEPRFSERLFQQAPDNLSIYFSELEEAIQNSDTELVKLILNQMSQAKYSHSLNPLSEQLIAAVHAYIDEHPIDEYIDLSAMQEIFPSEKSVDLSVIYPQNVLQMIQISNYNLPALRPLMLACENYQSDMKHCQKIAQTLINHSDTNIMTMIGYDLDKKIHELFGDEKSLSKSQASSQAFNDYQSCILKNHSRVDEMFVYDPTFMNIMSLGQHEGANLEQAALYLFEKYKDSSEQALVDPVSCGLRYVRSEQLSL